jgi:type IV pilus assembly protein PilM
MAHADEAARALEPLLDRLVAEIRGSIDFFTAQGQGTTLERIVLTGGGSLISGLADRIQSSLGLQTESGHPFDRAPVGKIKVSKQDVSVAEPFMGVAVGLALAGSGA